MSQYETIQSEEQRQRRYSFEGAAHSMIDWNSFLIDLHWVDDHSYCQRCNPAELHLQEVGQLLALGTVVGLKLRDVVWAAELGVAGVIRLNLSVA